MLFEIHQEGKIAYKRISEAELRRADTSHQTHIGLSDEALMFMSDNKNEYIALFIFKGYCDMLPCEIARIQRASGKYNSPKVSAGKSRGRNVVYKIIQYAKQSPKKDFYLLWVGLDTLTPLFLLIEEDSSDYNALNPYCNFDSLGLNDIGIIDKDQNFFSSIIHYIKGKIADVTIDLQKDLEISAELEDGNSKFNESDVTKAKNEIVSLGRAGEEFVYQYLERQKELNLVNSFEWINQNGEKYESYDFIINYASGLRQWMDVKTTKYGFEQPIIISNKEVHFVADSRLDDKYSIFRVYSKKELTARLKICSQCLAYIKKLVRDIDYMADSMADYNAKLINYKIQFHATTDAFNYISEEINLPVT